MNRLPTEERARVISALVEGFSINSIVRMTGVSKVTILRLLNEVGLACLTFENERLRDLPCAHIQADEIWGFCGAKHKNVRPENRDKPGHASVWTWYAIDAESKLIVSWIMGDRDAGHAHALIEDLASRLMSKPQLSTEGIGVYREAFALHSMHYNWCRKHSTIGMSPAMAGGLADRIWTIEDIVRLVEDAERKAIEAGALKRGPYRKRQISK